MKRSIPVILSLLMAGCTQKPLPVEVQKPLPPGTEATQLREPASPLGNLFKSKGLKKLAAMNAAELQATFASGVVIDIPDGPSDGAPIFLGAADGLDALANLLWQGKVFNKATSTLKNKTLFVGKAIEAKVYRGKLGDVLKNQTGKLPAQHGDQTFPIDGKESIILDYHQTSASAFRGIIDELRQVFPNEYPSLFLGRATMDGEMVLYFGLDFAK